MDIHVRITAEAEGENTEHHDECERTHDLNSVLFSATTAGGGRGEALVNNCMLFEMHDAAESAMVEAWDSSDDAHYWEPDYESLREAADDLAVRADALDAGGHTARLIEISSTSS